MPAIAARVETAGLADIITRRTSEDSVEEVGALPLLSYTLDDMWTQPFRFLVIAVTLRLRFGLLKSWMVITSRF